MSEREPGAGLRGRSERLQHELFLSVLMPTRPSVTMARRLAQAMREVRLPAGAVLYEKGDPAEAIFFIVEGTVATDDDGADPLSFGLGDIVGITDLNLDRPRARRAIVTADALLLSLGFDDWLEFQDENVEWACETRRVVGQMVHVAMCAAAPTFDDVALVEGAAGAFQDTLVERIVALHRSPYFERASVQAIAALAGRARCVQFTHDQVVVPRGTEARALYVVVQGAVCASRLSPPALQLGFGPGELVLGGGAFSAALAEYEVVGLRDGTLLVLEWSDVDDVIDDHPSLSRSLVRGIALNREVWLAAGRAKRETASPRSK